MKVGKDKHYSYNLINSLSRLDSYLNDTCKYEELESIPSRERLTYDNGFYVNCYSIFVDIRGSSKLTENHSPDILAKLYRGYISELVAIMQSFDNCREVNIVGDCVSGIFSYSQKNDVIQVISAASGINSIVNIFNYKLSQKSYKQFKIGIGIARGEALMIKAGYNGSGLNEVVWMGDVVNTASNLCNLANKRENKTKVLVIDKGVYDDLAGELGGRDGKTPYQNWFSQVTDDAYTGNLIRVGMEIWLNKQETILQRLIRNTKDFKKWKDMRNTKKNL